jgi:dienelactone hydrolase
MSVFRILSLAALLCLTLQSSQQCSAQAPELLKHFDYDKTAALEIKTLGTEMRGATTIHDITYASPRGGVVPAYLVVPKGSGPFAAVIWGHWYWRNSDMRNRKEFLDEAVALASAGVVSLLTDGPVARPGYVEDRTPLNEKQFSDMVQQIVDMRRGADLLLARKDVDSKRLAYVGHSYNATIGAFLSGIDRRFKAFVLMAGGISDEVWVKSPDYVKFRESVGAEKFDAVAKKYEWLDAGKFASHAAPATVFLQFATQEDSLTPDQAKLHAAYVSEPKRFKVYEAPHSLNREARHDRIAFLTKQLKLIQLPAKVIDAIPELFQPARQ